MTEFTSLRQAAAYAGVSYQTILNWSRIYDIGELKYGRVWVIPKEKLDAVLAKRAHVAAQIEALRADMRKAG